MKKLLRFLLKFQIIRGVFNAFSAFGTNVNLELPRIVHAGRKSRSKLEKLNFDEVLFVRSFAKNKEDFINKCESGEYVERNIQVRVYVYKRSNVVKEVVASSPVDSLRCTFNKFDGGRIWDIYAVSKGINPQELSHEEIFKLAINESKKNRNDPIQ